VPSLPRVLKLLTGITAGYLPAQTQVAEEQVLASLHVLEEKSSSQQMGSLVSDSRDMSGLPPEYLQYLTVGTEIS
jgi:hypothetical protein